MSRFLRPPRLVPVAVAILILSGGVAIQAAAQESTASNDDDPNVVVEPKHFQALDYRAIGPHRGGRSTAGTGVPGQPFTFFFGASGGGVWKTENAGETWANVSDGWFAAASIGDIKVAPSDPNVIYVGTGSGCPRGNISAGDGIYRSTDGGETWDHVWSPGHVQVPEMAIHPDDPDVVHAAVLGSVFGPNEERGIYRTEDGGETWERVLHVSDRTGFNDIAMDPTNPRILYAGAWTVERKPWAIVSGSEEGGIWKSVDGGDTWEKVEGGLPGGILGKIDVTISPADPDRIWALIEAPDENGGVWRSDDGGDSWSRINGERMLRQRAWYYTHIYADPRDENTVYALNTGFYKSTDGGRSWEQIQVEHGDCHDLWVNPDDPDILLQLNDGGAHVSLDGGAQWSSLLNQPTAEFYRVTVDDQFPYRVYGPQQDNTTVSVASHPGTGITPYEDWYSVGGCESGHIAVDPRDPDIIYSGCYGGTIDRVNLETGAVRNVEIYPEQTLGQAARNLEYRIQWNAPIRIDPHDPDVVYHASQYVMRTSDGGMSWETISPDLTRDDEEKQDFPGYPITNDATGVEVYDVIFSLEISPHEEGVIWAGSDDGLVHISRDDGASWDDVTPEGMPEFGVVNTIEISAHDPGRAFLAVYRYRQDDFRPYVFRTDDYGASWDLLTDDDNGIPSDHFVRVVREDPDRRGLLYAGTEFGMYASFDDGAHWQPFQLDLPVSPVTDLQVHRKDLVVATQGRSFYILDDLSPLHQLTDQVQQADWHLFEPRDHHRMPFGGFGLGYDSESAPETYGSGVHLFYTLNEVPEGEVKLDILDEAGEVVREFSSADQPSGPSGPFAAFFGGGAGATVGKDEGLNRFVWDGLYPGVETTPGAIMWGYSGGVTAVPGTYQVRMTVGDESQTRSFELRADPRREGVTRADYEAQFELGVQIRDRFQELFDAIRRIRSAREQIEATGNRAAEAGHEDLQERAGELAETLTGIENELIQTQNEAFQDALNFPPKLASEFAALYGYVAQPDGRPSQGAYERFEDLQAELDEVLGRLDPVMNQEIPAFNQELSDRGVPAVVVGGS